MGTPLKVEPLPFFLAKTKISPRFHFNFYVQLLERRWTRPHTMPTREDMMYPGGPSLHLGGNRMDRCAGCDATDVSLLACDDIQGPTGASDPSKRQRWVLCFRFVFSIEFSLMLAIIVLSLVSLSTNAFALAIF